MRQPGPIQAIADKLSEDTFGMGSVNGKLIRLRLRVGAGKRHPLGGRRGINTKFTPANLGTPVPEANEAR